jgi:hypothetical protein
MNPAAPVTMVRITHHRQPTSKSEHLPRILLPGIPIRFAMIAGLHPRLTDRPLQEHGVHSSASTWTIRAIFC